MIWRSGDDASGMMSQSGIGGVSRSAAPLLHRFQFFRLLIDRAQRKPSGQRRHIDIALRLVERTAQGMTISGRPPGGDGGPASAMRASSIKVTRSRFADAESRRLCARDQGRQPRLPAGDRDHAVGMRDLERAGIEPGCDRIADCAGSIGNPRSAARITVGNTRGSRPVTLARSSDTVPLPASEPTSALGLSPHLPHRTAVQAGR